MRGVGVAGIYVGVVSLGEAVEGPVDGSAGGTGGYRMLGAGEGGESDFFMSEGEASCRISRRS